LGGLLRPLWQFRALIVGSIWRELRAQSLGSVLGVAWLVLQPAAMVAVYTLVFSHVMGSRLAGQASSTPYAYSVYLCAGLLPWQFFADGVSRLCGVFVRHGGLMKKAAFPRLCLPVIELGIAAAQFALVAGLFLLFWAATGAATGWVAWVALPALLVQVVLMAGLGMLLATWHVFFRDVGQALAMALTFWFWLTPIVYPAHTLPAWAQDVLAWNPMGALVGFYQAALLWGQWPTAAQWWQLAGLAALAVLALALRSYRRHAGELVDEL
jgi:lipopolysaccharide transport system permease protein